MRRGGREIGSELLLLLRAAMACTAAATLQLQLQLELPCFVSSSAFAHVRSSRAVRGLGGNRLRRWWVIGAQSDHSPARRTVGAVNFRKPPQSRRSVNRVVADPGATKVEESVGEERLPVVEYDWEKEWYPMYLEAEMPKSAPLGLTVFDRSLVLFYDGDGQLNCFEDRCPHRSIS